MEKIEAKIMKRYIKKFKEGISQYVKGQTFYDGQIYVYPEGFVNMWKGNVTNRKTFGLMLESLGEFLNKKLSPEDAKKYVDIIIKMFKDQTTQILKDNPSYTKKDIDTVINSIKSLI